MTIQEAAQMVHENAKAHGWWDEERELPEVIALIHSEWSEALEEARNGRPMVYKLAFDDEDIMEPAFAEPGKENPMGIAYEEIIGKPEGVAVELIDGVIRILDLFGSIDDITIQDDVTGKESTFDDLLGGIDDDIIISDKIGVLVAELHAMTSESIIHGDFDTHSLVAAMTYAMLWVRKQGIDPEKLLLEKHAYNRTRPYKHGKLF